LSEILFAAVDLNIMHFKLIFKILSQRNCFSKKWRAKKWKTYNLICDDPYAFMNLLCVE